MPDSVDVIRASRSYVSSISAVHSEIRATVNLSVNNARKLLESAIDEYKSVNGGFAVGLRAIKSEKEDFYKDDIADYFPILLEWDNSRVELEDKNRLVHNLEERFVSSSTYNKALHVKNR